MQVGGGRAGQAGSRPWASSAPARPESTSPEPAVASQGVPVGLTSTVGRPGEATTVVEPLSSTVTPSCSAAWRACSSRAASMRAGSVRSSRPSSPACGVISVGAARGSRFSCWLKMVRPSASTRTGRSVPRIAARRAAAASSVPMPGPATQAWTRPAWPSRSQSPASGCTVSTASGQAWRTTAAGTGAVTTRTMPAPPCTAPPADSTAAPANRSLPASRPITPRRYLSDSALGRGSSSRRSPCWAARAAGSPSR